VVIFGDYPNKKAALTAKNSLPADLQKAAPWPRYFREIQAEIQK
jgi:septal ring-binding cell division protein DamX